MISAVISSLDGNPLMSSGLLLAVVYALTIAPVFTTDPYLKLLPMFLIPTVMIASSGTTGFSMNIELLMGAGILTAGFIKLLTYNERIEERLKHPQTDKTNSSILYIGILGVFGMLYVLTSKLSGMPTHLPQPQASSPSYYLLVVTYIVAILGSITGFKINFGGNSSTVKVEQPEPEEEEEEEKEEEKEKESDS